MAIKETFVAGGSSDKLYIFSGQYTTTIKDSEDESGIDTGMLGIAWDGTNTPWCGEEADKLYLESADFASTLKTSLLVGSLNASPSDIHEYEVSGTQHTLWCGQAGTDDKTRRRPSAQRYRFLSHLPTASQM